MATVPQFIDHFGVSRNTVYEEINSGRLASYQVGRRRFISARAADEWQKRLEAATATQDESAQMDAYFKSRATA